MNSSFPTLDGNKILKKVNVRLLKEMKPEIGLNEININARV